MSLNQADARRNLLAHKLYKATKQKGTAPPVTYTNATMQGSYTTPVWPVRADANQHMQHASRGLSAQIVRAA